MLTFVESRSGHKPYRLPPVDEMLGGGMLMTCARCGGGFARSRPNASVNDRVGDSSAAGIVTLVAPLRGKRAVAERPGSELIQVRNCFAEIGKPAHNRERDQQAGQTKYNDKQNFVFLLSRNRGSRPGLASRLNADRQRARRRDDGGKDKEQRMRHVRCSRRHKALRKLTMSAFSWSVKPILNL